MPELKQSPGTGGLGDLRSLAGLAGVNLGNVSGASEAIRPDLYPDIVQSIPFSLYILSRQVTTASSQKPQRLQTFFKNKEENSTLGYIKRIFSKKDSQKEALLPADSLSINTLKLTSHQEALCQNYCGASGC